MKDEKQEKKSSDTKKYDVFISYRRDGGFEFAEKLHKRLLEDGYGVALDIDTLRNGRFDKVLQSRIEECTDFVVVLNKGCFDRTLDASFPPEKDWMRKELAHALKMKKNVVPVMLTGFDWPNGLPDDIRDVQFMNGPKYDPIYFASFYDDLKGKFLASKPRRRKRWLILGMIVLCVTVLAYVLSLFFGSRAEEPASRIRIDAIAQKAVLDHISSEDGFRPKILGLADDFARADKLYDERKWNESALAFANYANQCRELIKLDDDRLKAKDLKSNAVDVRQKAKNLGAMRHAMSDWTLAEEAWQKANEEFRKMEFGAASVTFDSAIGKFEKCISISEVKQQDEDARKEDAEKLVDLRALIKIKVDEAKADMNAIDDFRADQIGFRTHIANADELWRFISAIEKEPKYVVDAAASLKRIEESVNSIRKELDWLKSNRSTRDEAKGVEAKIVRAIEPDINMSNASNYACEAYLDGVRLRQEGNAALVRGDFSSAKEKLEKACTKLSEAVSDASRAFVSDFAEKLRSGAKIVRLEYEKHWSGNIFVAYLPQSWFDPNEMSVPLDLKNTNVVAELSFDLLSGTNVVKRILESYDKRTAELMQDGTNQLCLKGVMRCRESDTKGVDAYMLHVPHRLWPVTFRFVPPGDVNVDAGKFNKPVSPLVLSSMIFKEENIHVASPHQIWTPAVVASSNLSSKVKVSYNGKGLLPLTFAGLMTEGIGMMLVTFSQKECASSNDMVRCIELSLIENAGKTSQ